MPRMADCHPERRHMARGLCASCYQDDYGRRHGRRLARRTGLTGLLHLGETLDPLLPALRGVPAACPWCRNACLRHYEGAAEINCPLCGWEAILEPPRTAQGLAWR